MSDMNEREAVVRVMGWRIPASADAWDIADAILAAGFRRRAQDANTHTHGLDDIACPERLVGECVIEREVAHAVAIEREKVAAFVHRVAPKMPMYDTATNVPSGETANVTLAEAIRNGAHDEATR